MWTKTLTVKFKGHETQVLIWLSTEESHDEQHQEVVSIQAMVNEYYLIETILFKDRDSAHDFIKHYPPSMASAFLTREAYANGAIDR